MREPRVHRANWKRAGERKTESSCVCIIEIDASIFARAQFLISMINRSFARERERERGLPPSGGAADRVLICRGPAATEFFRRPRA